jgi:LemA protein
MATPLRKIVKAFYPGRPAAEKASRRPKRNGSQVNWFRFVGLLVTALVIAKAGLLFYYYNTFVSMQYDVDEAAAQVDAQLQRRRNVIRNLSIMVMNYAEHEREIFTHATDTRKELVQPRPGAPPGQEEKQQVPGTAGSVDDLLARVFAIAEKYPDLRLSENFRRYMDALVDIEARIAAQRMIYNTRANAMSTVVDKFPGFLFARMYGFKPPAFFEPEEEARIPLRVDY